MAQIGIEVPARRADLAAPELDHGRAAADLVLEHDDADDGETTPPLYDIFVIPADYTLETLYERWRSGKIVLPRLRRRYTWGLPHASKLIESLMAGIPVPPVYLSTTDEETSIVIDGMQRLLTIFSYFEGAFPKDAPHGVGEFRIAGINRDNVLYGKTFGELDEEDGRRLKDSSLRAMTIVHNDPSDRSGIYEVIERLGAGAAPLAAQEVRSCAYRGPFSELLDDLNGLGEWRDVLGRPDPDPRMKDTELVLRYMALFHDGGRYAHPMKGFLSDFMGAHRDPGDGYLGAERLRFASTCRAVTESLGPAPFNNGRGQLQVPLFDSVFVAFAGNGTAGCPGDIADRLEALRADPEFGRLAGAQSTATGAVRGRLRLARRMLFE